MNRRELLLSLPAAGFFITAKDGPSSAQQSLASTSNWTQSLGMTLSDFLEVHGRHTPFRGYGVGISQWARVADYGGHRLEVFATPTDAPIVDMVNIRIAEGVSLRDDYYREFEKLLPVDSRFIMHEEEICALTKTKTRRRCYQSESLGEAYSLVRDVRGAGEPQPLGSFHSAGRLQIVAQTRSGTDEIDMISLSLWRLRPELI